MNKLNRKLEYSLMALKHMSGKNPGELTTAKEVSASYKTPFDATARVMQMMAQSGLLKSEQGALGGYHISKDLGQVSLLDLIELIEGPSKITKCMHGEPCEIQTSCNIISPIAALNGRLNEFYQAVKVKELLSKERL